MSNIFINDIVGTGAYVVPEQVGGLNTLNTAFASLINNVSGITFERAIAWVKDSAKADGSEGARTLNCLLAGVEYSNDECPSESEVDTLVSGIESALLSASGIGTITSVGVIEFNLVEYYGMGA